MHRILRTLGHSIGLWAMATSLGCGRSARTEMLDQTGAAGAHDGVAAGHSNGSGSGGADGLGGVGGPGGVDGSGGVDGPGGATGLDEVRIVRGDPEATDWWDLTIQGAALGDFEGKIISVRVGHPDRAPERLGSGQMRIVEGGFALALPQVWEAHLYKRKLAFIDANDNGLCDPDLDPVFSDARAMPHFVLTLQNGPQSQLTMPKSDTPDEHCSMFNAPWPAG